jgi:ABC-type spermidine/putrescine transport system permease subunit I
MSVRPLVLQQDWGSLPVLRVRKTAGRFGLLLLPLALLLAPAAAWAGPATEADMSLYTRISALNVCISRAAGIEFDKAVAVAGETLAQVIQGQHEGTIAQVGPKPLTIDELRKGAINSAVLGVVTTLVTLLLALPCAYGLHHLQGRLRPLISAVFPLAECAAAMAAAGDKESGLKVQLTL